MMSAPTQRITIVSNPASGGAISDDDLHRRIDEHIGRSGIEVTWSPTSEDDPGFGQAGAAVDDDHELVVACGGDGTVRAVLESVAGSSTMLGVVPLGTGNLLAANLGIPEGLDAVPTALGGQHRVLDVATVNDERFAVMAGVGFDALMIRDANPKVKKRFGSIAYVISGLRHVPAQIFGASISIDGKLAWQGRTAMVLVGNCGSVTGGLEVFPEAEPDDGELDVAVLTADRFRDWLRIGWRLVRRRDQPRELVKRFRGTDIDVRLSHPVDYELDGEDRPAASQLRFGIEPSALQVRC